ncbi:MAG: NADH-quinone oxidoreductase subunit H [Chloroflexi bacterium]|nr:NADH-quinone oxidoreductase subunit H [Chloroflexota bacterium]
MDALGALWRVLVFPGGLYLIAGSLAITWLDRALVARWQSRRGPPWYQPLADLIKLLAKEDISPRGTHAWMAVALPIASLAATLTAGLYVPVGAAAVGAFQGDLIVVLFLLSVPTLAYFLAGWATPSVYGVLGGNRSLLQYYAYEVPLIVGMAAPAVHAQSWAIADLVAAQQGFHWHALYLPVGLAVAVAGLLGKLKRVPFDIPHAKSEVGAGPLTEYSGRKLGLWKLTVSLQTLVGIHLLVAVYLGGVDGVTALGTYPAYLVKTLLCIAGFSLIQVLYARLRIDQMAEIGWRLLVPLGLVQMLATIWMGRA